MTNITLRRAERADADAVIGLIIALAEFEDLPPPDAGAQARLIEHGFGDAPKFEVMLAEVEGAPGPVGYALLLQTYSTFLAQPSLYLEDVFVLPEHRKQGIGTALLRFCVQTAHERNTEYCIGFSTAVSRATDAIERQRTTVGSHERIGVFRIFGRDAGYTALYTAYTSSIRCCIPEYKVNVDQLIDLLLEDKRANPSSYALVVLSEGAQWDGYAMKEYGEADAFGHRKKASVAEDLSDAIKKRSGDETIVSDLTYDLRGGPADFVDKMVANTFAGMAIDLIQEGKSGLMTAISHGCYAAVPIPDPKLGPRKVDVARMYDTARYRPSYTGKMGLPVFLTHA